MISYHVGLDLGCAANRPRYLRRNGSRWIIFFSDPEATLAAERAVVDRLLADVVEDG